MGSRLGIGVITFNRKEILKTTIENIRQFTKEPFEFVVADDGSSDGTQDLLSEMCVPFVSGDNRGIAWNRNRALWYLKVEKNCDVIIIFEDDCHPVLFGWEQEWIKAAEAFGHVNFMPDITLEIDNDVSSGSGTAADPFIAPMHQAYCVGYHARALDFVGYLDVRFLKYGEEHVEHTHRFMRAGYGGLAQYLTPERGQVYYIKGGLKTLPSESHGTSDVVMRNIQIHKEIQGEPLYRAPWRDDAQMFTFREEIETALSRPAPQTQSGDHAFDHIISLGGDEKPNLFIEQCFGRVRSHLFDGFVTPFHTLIQLFRNGFSGLFSTACLYGYHDALRCRDTLLVYHNCLERQPGEKASVEMFHAQLDRLRRDFARNIEALDTLCDGRARVLFVRDWKETLHYEGSHRPSHTKTADFQALVEAIAARYPQLDFKVLFVNFGAATGNDPRMIFANTDTPDNSGDERKAKAWKKMFALLGVSLKD